MLTLPAGYIAIAFRKPRLGEWYLTNNTITNTTQVTRVAVVFPDAPPAVIVKWHPEVVATQEVAYVTGGDFKK